MERWTGKVAVVTGASAGIGLAIAKELIDQGMTVVGLARRKDKMIEEMKDAAGSGKFIAKECDISVEKDVDEAFKFIRESFETIHVLVNNAGMFKMASVEDADMKDLQEVINVNFIGLLRCSKQALKLMKENDHEAHIINVNGALGHKVSNITLADGFKLNMNVYSPTKYAVTSLSEVLTNELLGGKIRVSSLSPGYVQTDIGGAEAKEKIGVELSKVPYLKPEDIAGAVVYILGTPHHVQITELTIKPLGEIF